MPIDHRFWALILIGLGVLEAANAALILTADAAALPPPTAAVNLLIGGGAIAAGIGFWQRRRWGLTLALVVVWVSVVRVFAVSLLFPQTLGAFPSAVSLVCGMLVAVLFTGFAVRIRDQFTGPTAD
ncbi:MAG: hypothetical protein ACFB51_09080 [Anaerolineae bacterium]